MLIATFRIATWLDLDTRSSHGGRDVAWLGDCDTGCQLLAEKLGWGDELKRSYKKKNMNV